jgi:sugar transferase (PEP-CTERM/EpsH1 system associated)
MRILFVTPYIPSRVRVRPYNFLRALAERGHSITLLALQPPGDEGETLPDLRRWCEQVQVVPHSPFRIMLNELKALPGRLPLQAAYSVSPVLNQITQDILADERLDVAHVEHLRGAVLAKALSSLPVVFDSVDSISLLFGKVLQDAPGLKSRFMAQLDLGRTRLFEGQLTRRFQEVIVTSAADRQMLLDLGCSEDRVTVVPNGVDLEYFEPQQLERDHLKLVFTGKMSYHANVAAVKDLVELIMPKVWAKQPDVQLAIVGKDPSPAVQALAAHPGVTVTGSVPDLRPYLARAAIAVSTVRYGVGVQNKVLEAMAMATPVVCSPQASSSLQAQHGRDLLVGDRPDVIAEHILDLLQSPEKRQAIGAAGRRYVEMHQSWDRSIAVLETVYARAVHEQSSQVTARG